MRDPVDSLSHILPEEARAALDAQAIASDVPAGTTLFQEGDAAQTLFWLETGRCMLSRNASPLGAAAPGALLDEVAVLGGLPHTQRAICLTDCRVRRLERSAFLAIAGVAAAIQVRLAARLLAAEAREQALAAPMRSRQGNNLLGGPFLFRRCRMIFAFCDASLTDLRRELPAGLHLVPRLARGRDPLLIVFADFPHAVAAAAPEHPFAYTETTLFVPVRFRGTIGLLAPLIYPSTWEPILLGREIYGFPKWLGETHLAEGRAGLRVDGMPVADLSWERSRPATEPAIVGALFGWLGAERHLAAGAFRLGGVFQSALRLPPYRRVDVFNHKQIADIGTRGDAPVFAVDQLTRAVFGVLRWHRIEALEAASLRTEHRIGHMDVRLLAAFDTTLDLRLSAGRVARDYLRAPGT